MAFHAPIRRATKQHTKGLNITLWILQVATGSAFLVAGAAKLYSVPDMVGLFDRIGLGQWFRHMTGAIEFGAAVLLFYPGLATIGALVLACTMAGAIAVHLMAIGGSPVPAIILLGCCLFIAWGRQHNAPNFHRRPSRAS